MTVLISYFVGLGGAITVLLSLGLLFYRLLRRTPEEGLALASVLVMLLIELTGLIGNTSIGFIALLVLALIGLLLPVRGTSLRIGQKRISIEGRYLDFFTPGIVGFMLLSLIAAVLFYGSCYQNWDEFVQWGKSLRFMGQFHRLPFGADFDGFDYMQSLSTNFHYFVGRFTGFDEAASYVSNAMLCLSVVPLALSGSKWKDALRVGALYAAVIVLTLTFYDLPLYNLYTDCALTCFAGASVAYAVQALTPKQDTKLDILSLVLTALMLLVTALMKPQAGPLFAGIALVAILFVCLTYRRIRLTKKQFLTGLIAICAALLVAILLMKLIESRQTGGWLGFNGRRASEYIKDGALLNRLFFTLYNGLFRPLAGVDGASYVNLFFICIGLTLASALFLPQGVERNRHLRLSVLYVLGFVGYFVVIYLTYLIVLPVADMENGTSLERYLSLYLMTGVLPLLAPLLKQAGSFSSEQGSLTRGLTSLLLIFVLLLPAVRLKSAVLYSVTSTFRWNDPYYQMYMTTRAGAERVKALAGDERIYYIHQTHDSAAVAAEYTFSHTWMRTVGTYRFPKDDLVSTTGLIANPIEKLPELIQNSGAGYLYIGETDAYLNENFPALFGMDAPTAGALYRVTEDGLTYVDTIAITREEAKAFERAH